MLRRLAEAYLTLHLRKTGLSRQVSPDRTLPSFFPITILLASTLVDQATFRRSKSTSIFEQVRYETSIPRGTTEGSKVIKTIMQSSIANLGG